MSDRYRSLAPLSACLMLLLSVFVAAGASRAEAATFTVTVAADTDDGVCDSHCSLREAITAANALPGVDTIAFAIAPAGDLHVLTLSGQLPEIEGDLVIDGYTQSGAEANTNATGGLDTVLKIELRSPDPGTVVVGLVVRGSNVTIRGLAIVNFLGAVQIDLLVPEQIVIAGNFLGTDAAGLTGSQTRYGVVLTGAADVRIGGPDAADRNLIAGLSWYGVTYPRIDGTPIDLTIQGNLFGTDITGQAPLGGAMAGIYIFAPYAHHTAPTDRILIGGATTAEGNVFANAGAGIDMQRDFSVAEGASATIAHNTFGTDTTHTMALANTTGIRLQGPWQAEVSENYIAHSGLNAITVTGALTTHGTGTRITGNTLVGNSGLGIDLGNDGRTPNDADDSDTGPNGLLNFPVLTRLALDADAGMALLRATVQAAPSTQYAIELFNIGTASRPEGSDAYGLFESITVTTDAAGRAEILHTLPIGSLQAGHRIVATLTDVPHGYTSEISDAVTVAIAGPAITGLVMRDGGTPLAGAAVQLTGTQSALVRAAGDGTFRFIDLQPGGTYQIQVLTNGYRYLPAVREIANLTLSSHAAFSAQAVPAIYTVNLTDTGTGDAWCDETACTLREAIEEANDHPGADTIRFAIPGAGPHALRLDAPLPPIVDDLLIDGYSQPGAAPNTNATGALNAVLQIALQPASPATSIPAGLFAIGARLTVRGLAIAGFGSGVTALHLGAAGEATLEGNYFGTTPDGLALVTGSENGVGATTNVTVGGATPASRNLFAGHSGAAIATAAGSAGRANRIRVRGNLIGTDATGLDALPNGVGLLHAAPAPDAEADLLRIGGDLPAEGNVIAGNDEGIRVMRPSGSDADAVDQLIAGNLIGLAADGVTPLGNTLTAIGLCGELRARIEGNVIAHNGGPGVRLCTRPTAGGYGVSVTGNRIFDNFGLAIDLGGDGRSPNDPDDGVSTAPNRLQNFPVLTEARESLQGLRVAGTLTSRPNRTYAIELVTTGGSPQPGVDAREILDSFTVTTDAAGVAAFTRDVASTFQAGEAIAAIATDAAAMMTSELSDAQPLAPLPRHAISGTLTRQGLPLPNVRVTLSGDRTDEQTTGADGRYAFTALPATGSYTITPVDAAYVFTPASAPFAALGADGVADFSASDALFTRYLAEGAAGAFWETTIALLNASQTPTTATLSFLLPGGARETVSVPMTGPGHATFDPATIPALDGATFSTVVSAAQPLVASRVMRWGAHRELGAHAEAAVAEPRETWYFAEGATGCFDLFYLLVNPGAVAADVEITFVRRAPLTPITQRYTVPPFARETVRVNAEEGLGFAEVSARIAVRNGVPIVAERTMYASCFGATWRGGHDAVASAAPAQEWFFAEGATGSFFDLYLLLANFDTQAARVDVEYLLADGVTLKKPYVVPAGSRVTIDVAGEAPQLAEAAVSMIVRSANGVPVVAERSQWWPHGGWYEGHASSGATQPGVEWQVAGAEVGGPHGASSYLLIANTGDAAGQVQVRAIFADGSRAALPQPLALGAHSRTTVDLAAAFPQADGERFGLVVESLAAAPAPAAPISVELSGYNDTTDASGVRRFWGAGINSVATRIR